MDLSPYYKKLGIKYVRLHDVPWVFDDAVNVYYIFPHPDADPNQAQNYDFSHTDWYLKSIESLGIHIIYELGPSIEYPKQPPRHTHPPKNFKRWASVCVHIIKHYNGDWDNGFHYGIRRWEIWNEPDGGSSWRGGTPEQYYDLYVITARAIKRYDPDLKVGGPVLAFNLSFQMDS